MNEGCNNKGYQYGTGLNWLHTNGLRNKKIRVDF